MITIGSSNPGSVFTFSKSSGSVNGDYVSLQDSVVVGGADWVQGVNSINVSGNSGWVFTEASNPNISGGNIYTSTTESNTIDVTNNDDGKSSQDQIVENNETDLTNSESIKEEIERLKALIQELLGQQSGSKFIFTINMGLGAVHSDVKELQKWLNSHGFQLAFTGPGSPGNETDIFGYLTKQALIKFQQLNNISPSNGRLGPQTRARINGI